MSEKYSICPGCGVPSSSKARSFCPFCGEDLRPSRCVCGEELLWYYLYCPNCGKEVEESNETNSQPAD